MVLNSKRYYTICLNIIIIFHYLIDVNERYEFVFDYFEILHNNFFTIQYLCMYFFI